MDSKILLSQVNLDRMNELKKSQPEAPVENINEKQKTDNSKKLKLALAGLAVAGTAIVAAAGVVKHKNLIKEAQNFFNKYLKATSGNNNVLDDSVTNINEAIRK